MEACTWENRLKQSCTEAKAELARAGDDSSCSVTDRTREPLNGVSESVMKYQYLVDDTYVKVRISRSTGRTYPNDTMATAQCLGSCL